MASSSGNWRNTTISDDSDSDCVIESSLLQSGDIIPSSGNSSISEDSIIVIKPKVKRVLYVLSDTDDESNDNNYENSDDSDNSIKHFHKINFKNETGSTNSTLTDTEKNISFSIDQNHQSQCSDCGNSSSKTLPMKDKRERETDSPETLPRDNEMKTETSPNKNSSFHYENNDGIADVSYFDPETQLAILQSLNDNTEEPASYGILSPQNRQSVNNLDFHEKRTPCGVLSPKNKQSDNKLIMNVSPKFKRTNEESSSNIAVDLVDDIAGNKENLLAEKMRLEYEIKEVTSSLRDKKETVETINLIDLPDKGLKLKIALQREQRNLDMLNEQLDRVNRNLQPAQNLVSKEKPPKFAALPSANLHDMGEKALETHRVQQALTVDALRHLHSSLNSCPSNEEVVPDPTGLRIPLMDHQKQALAWCIWRENEKPSGGILADDMGLGKTLTMISLVMKRKEESVEDEEEEDDVLDRRHKYQGGTLIVCPSSLLGQWESEINGKVKSRLLSFEVHHGSRREKKAKRLARPDIIITSYAIIRSEFQNNSEVENKSTEGLFAVKWKRIILDEAHSIRNHKTKTAEAVFQLKGTHRWALTGTPVHNKTQDFYALVKFLRCRPFDDLNIWKKWVEAKDETGSKRLNMLTKSLMLRRTKEMLMSEGKLKSLPEKSCKTIMVELSKEELALYEEVSNLSKTLLAQFLCQKAEKEQLLSHGIQVTKQKYNVTEKENPFNKHPALNRLYNRVINMQNVKTHEILVLLLRLRQVCCHPTLMKSMIEKEAIAHDLVEDDDGTDIDLVEKMSSMNVDDIGDESTEEAVEKNVFNANNPIFQPEWMSSKIKAILNLLKDHLLESNDKIVIVSQWSSMLDLLYQFLKEYKNCKCECLTGKVPVDQRMSIVSEFNNTSSSVKVLLLSLTAGGTGLNLIGGNHLIICDIHWNPQLEAQACDRIYRMGQNKPVTIYKFICTETIEERIRLLQNDKLAMADDILSGVKHSQVSKLTLNDLKMLFNVT